MVEAAIPTRVADAWRAGLAARERAKALRCIRSSRRQGQSSEMGSSSKLLESDARPCPSITCISVRARDHSCWCRVAVYLAGPTILSRSLMESTVFEAKPRTMEGIQQEKSALHSAVVCGALFPTKKCWESTTARSTLPSVRGIDWSRFSDPSSPPEESSKFIVFKLLRIGGILRLPNLCVHANIIQKRWWKSRSSRRMT